MMLIVAHQRLLHRQDLRARANQPGRIHAATQTNAAKIIAPRTTRFVGQR
jgi:hypothetical protein